MFESSISGTLIMAVSSEKGESLYFVIDKFHRHSPKWSHAHCPTHSLPICIFQWCVWTLVIIYPWFACSDGACERRLLGVKRLWTLAWRKLHARRKVPPKDPAKSPPSRSPPRSPTAPEEDWGRGKRRRWQEDEVRRGWNRERLWRRLYQGENWGRGKRRRWEEEKVRRGWGKKRMKPGEVVK